VPQKKSRWEFTRDDGLNYAVRAEPGRDESVYFYCIDELTGEVCRRFGFDVGQPMSDPPVHKAHVDQGLGSIERIYSFKSLNELSFGYIFGDERFSVEFDGRDGLEIRFYSQPNSRVKTVLVHERDGISTEIDVVPGVAYRVTDKIISFENNCRREHPDFSEAEALRQCVYANALRSPSGKLYIPVNRAWVKMIGRMFGCEQPFKGPLLFNWDAAFNSIIASNVDMDLALSNLRLLMEQLEPGGFFRQVRVGEKRNNLTALPVASLAVWKLFEQNGDRGILKEFYDPLVFFNEWLGKNRDRNGDGLLEWGCESAGRGMELRGRYAPWYESGLDDSPMWEEERFSEEKACFESSAICLNSIYCLDHLVLGRMAEVLGQSSRRSLHLEKYEKLKARINARMWDSSRSVYANLGWNGQFSAEISPTSFYPLIAGIPDEARAAKLIATLRDERQFWGEHPLTSISRQSKHFRPRGDYWRGRVWPPMNYLVGEGLWLYDRDSAEALAAKSKKLFMKEWLSDGHAHENYCADTGLGEVPGKYYRSCPFYTWAGLLLL
jgi:putative isomerase